MTKNGYFSDLLKTLPSVWSFKYDNTILIDNPKKGDTFKSGDIIIVKAYIDKIATYAILTIGKHREFKNLLENEDKGVVTFSDYTLTDSDIGNLDVKVEVGRFMYLPSASQVVQVLVEGSGDVVIAPGTGSIGTKGTMLDDFKDNVNETDYTKYEAGWKSRILDELELFFDGDEKRSH